MTSILNDRLEFEPAGNSSGWDSLARPPMPESQAVALQTTSIQDRPSQTIQLALYK